jgi:hypothetical protein
MSLSKLGEHSSVANDLTVPGSYGEIPPARSQRSEWYDGSRL